MLPALVLLVVNLLPSTPPPASSAPRERDAQAVLELALDPKEPAATSLALPAGSDARALIWPAMALAALAAVAFALSRKKKRGHGRLLKIVETASMGPKRQLVLVQVGDETLLVGASEGGVTLLSRCRVPLDQPSETQPAAPESSSWTAPVPAAPGSPGFEKFLLGAAEDQHLRMRLGTTGKDGAL